MMDLKKQQHKTGGIADMTEREHECEELGTWVRLRPSQQLTSCVVGPNHDLADL